MDTLPPELVSVIIRESDGVTKAVLRCVSWQWLGLVDDLVARSGKVRGPLKANGHVCTSPMRCAARYARAAIAKRRWRVLEWMSDCTFDETWLDRSNKVAQEACLAAASDGDMDRLASFYKPGALDAHKMCLTAAMHGHIHVVKWLVERDKKLVSDALYAKAARGGQRVMLEWLLEGGPRQDVRACAGAAKSGRLDILQWLRSTECPWDQATCAAAAKIGRLDILEWARSNGCPWDKTTVSGASKHGHLHIVQWARANGCPWDATPCEFAAASGRLDMLEWLRDNGCPWDENVCESAAHRGHLDVLMWAHERGCPQSVRVCDIAVKYGHLHVLKWARAKGYECDDAVFHIAVEWGHVDVLQWLVANEGPWVYRSDACYLAASNGHVRILAWTRSIGWRWSKWALGGAMRAGHLPILQWVVASDLEWDSEGVCMNAVRGSHLRILQWLKEQGLPWHPDLCLLEALKATQLETAKWIAGAGGHSWDAVHCANAARQGDIRLLYWLRAQGCPWDKRVCESPYSTVTKWALDNGCPTL